MGDKDSAHPIKSEYTGQVYRVVHCEGALNSFNHAVQRLRASKRKSMIRGMVLQIERLASGNRLSTETFLAEGFLPNDKKFFALKRIPVRAYCWRSAVNHNTWFISHYIYKDHQKLKDKDIQRVHDNWRKLEGL